MNINNKMYNEGINNNYSLITHKRVNNWTSVKSEAGEAPPGRARRARGGAWATAGISYDITYRERGVPINIYIYIYIYIHIFVIIIITSNIVISLSLSLYIYIYIYT